MTEVISFEFRKSVYGRLPSLLCSSKQLAKVREGLLISIHISISRCQVKLEIPHYASFVSLVRNDRITMVTGGRSSEAHQNCRLKSNHFMRLAASSPNISPMACHSERSEESPDYLNNLKFVYKALSEGLGVGY